MPTQIQKFPQSFLGMVGNTSGGVTPQVVSDSIVGTIDFGPFFDITSYNRAFITGSNIFAVGSVAWSTPVIPENRNRFVHGISIQIGAVAAAESLTASLYVGLQGAGGFPIGPQYTAAAGQNMLLGQWLDRPLPIRNGDIFAVYVSARTGATLISAGMTVLYVDY